MKPLLKRRWILVLSFLALPLAGALSQNAASATQQEHESNRIEVVSLGWESSGGRKLIVVVQSGYCIGEAKPQLRVESNEAPRTERFPRGAVILKAIVERAPAAAVPPVEAGSEEPVPVCNGVGLRLKMRVNLACPLEARPVLERTGAHLRKALHLP